MDVPGFVKTAADVTDQNYNSVDIDHFADPAKRLYPLNTKSNTWLSREHFRRDETGMEKTAAELIKARISKAASFWNLDESIRMRQADEPLTVFKINIDGDRDTDKIELDLTGHYKQACEQFYENRASYPYTTRRSFAQQVLAAPEAVKEEIAVDVEEGLHKMADYGSCTGDTARDAVFLRMCYVRTKAPETYGELVKVAHHLQHTEGLVDINLLHKTALILDTVDRAHGLHVKYGDALPFPEDSLFGFTEKRASLVRDEALVMSDLGELRQSGDLLTDALIAKDMARVEGLEHELIDLTVAMANAGVLNCDHTMVNIVMTSDDTLGRLDLELAVTCDPANRNEHDFAAMLGRLLGFYIYAVEDHGPERLAAFSNELFAKSGASPSEISEAYTDHVQAMMGRQLARSGRDRRPLRSLSAAFRRPNSSCCPVTLRPRATCTGWRRARAGRCGASPASSAPPTCCSPAAGVSCKTRRAGRRWPTTSSHSRSRGNTASRA